MDIKEIRDIVHKKSLLFRSIDTMVNGFLFERLWTATSEKEQEVILKKLKKGDKVGIQEWLKYHEDLQPGEMSMQTLRIEASKYRIFNYSRLTRAELVAKVKEKYDEEKRNV